MNDCECDDVGGYMVILRCMNDCENENVDMCV